MRRPDRARAPRDALRAARLGVRGRGGRCSTRRTRTRSRGPVRGGPRLARVRGDRRGGGTGRAVRRRARPRGPHGAGDGRPALGRRSCTRSTGRSRTTRAGSTPSTVTRRASSASRRRSSTAGRARWAAAASCNPIESREWPFSADKDDYLLWIGRMSPGQGSAPRDRRRAREARSRSARGPGPDEARSEFFAEEVEPLLGDGSSTSARPTRSAKRRALRARAALLMPIRWPEPFGLVMVEALACGTPVIAFPEGSVPEVVRDGVTGFVVDDEHAMAQAIARAGSSTPRPAGATARSASASRRWCAATRRSTGRGAPRGARPERTGAGTPASRRG